MRKDKRFIYVFVALFIVYVSVDILTPDPISWAVTFRSDDKNPFGSFILNERSSDLFNGGFDLSYQTISELEETSDHLFILTEYADIDRTDADKLMEILNSGRDVFIGATSFNPTITDTLDFDIHFEYRLLNQNIFESPQAIMKMKGSGASYVYPSTLLLNYFKLEDDHDWNINATVEENPVVISKEIGEGKLILCAVPYIFTNFGMLYAENYKAAAEILTMLPPEQVLYTMYYKLGRREASTPFRYFLREDALRWALYVGILLVALFLMISSWRKQRAIPLMNPPENTTVAYVKTLGSLFYRERNHKKAALKLISHFLHHIKENYFVHIDYSEKFYKHLAAKSGKDLQQVVHTFELIQQVKALPVIEEKTLIDLSKKIEGFT